MKLSFPSPPRRIVCLTEEPTEILCLLGEAERIVGISSYTERPPWIREEKPVVSAFVGGSVRKITALEPDLIIGFSDVQATLAAELIHANLPVMIFNQRSIEEILEVILCIGRIVNQGEKAEALVRGYMERLETARLCSEAQSHHPRVYFEEWDDPHISAIQWVSELIAYAGGVDIFAEKSTEKSSINRQVTTKEIIERQPDVMIASWCGKALDRDSVFARGGFAAIPAIANGALHEMDPAIILQPGPASIGDGLEALENILRPLGETS